jgi:hypothetical protein
MRADQACVGADLAAGQKLGDQRLEGRPDARDLLPLARRGDTRACDASARRPLPDSGRSPRTFGRRRDCWRERVVAAWSLDNESMRPRASTLTECGWCDALWLS